MIWTQSCTDLKYMRIANDGIKDGGQHICLSALLTGKALEVYSRLPAKGAQDYEILKDALLK